MSMSGRIANVHVFGPRRFWSTRRTVRTVILPVNQVEIYEG